LIEGEATLLRQLARFSKTGNDKGVFIVSRKLRSHVVAKQALAVGLASCA
jgi:hypothetical protein